MHKVRFLSCVKQKSGNNNSLNIFPPFINEQKVCTQVQHCNEYARKAVKFGSFDLSMQLGNQNDALNVPWRQTREMAELNW